MIGRHLLAQPGDDLFPAWGIRGQGLLVAAAPAFDLTLYVTFGLAQVAQATGVVVHAVQLDHALDEALAQRFGALGIQAQFRRQVRAQDDALDPVHDVELATNQ
ncbi:hypothetical protein D3C81_925160 [compost metagenome]